MMVPQFQRSRHGRDYEFEDLSDTSSLKYRNPGHHKQGSWKRIVKVCVGLLSIIIATYAIAYLHQYLKRESKARLESDKLLNSCEPEIQEAENECKYELSLDYMTGAPDGVKKQMLTFNGQFPGPTLRCTRGKFLTVRVTNNLDETTSVHWHGIEQNLSPFFDGPEGVTQCPIVPGTSMLYRFQLFQAGTYWYHSHHGHQYVEGAWGPLIIDNAPEVWGHLYDDEMTITLNDWHHLPAKVLRERYMQNDDVFPLPDSLLINGRASYNCTRAMLDGKDCDPLSQTPMVISVRAGRRYRLRVINAAASSRFEFSIDGHQLQAIEADGVDTVVVQPVDKVQIWTAQRYSFILTTKANVTKTDFWIRVRGIFTFEEFTGVLHYESETNGDQRRNLTEADSSALRPNASSIQGRPEQQRFDYESMANACRGSKNLQQKNCYSNLKPKHLSPIPHKRRKTNTTGNKLVSPVNTPNTTYPVMLDQNDCRPFHNDGETSAPDYYDRLITINAHDCANVSEKTGTIGKGRTRLCFNEIQYVPGDTDSVPVLFQVVQGKNITSSINHFHTPNLDEVIQIVINNQNKRAHPWHLHGHTFWVVGTGAPGQGDYNHTRNAASLSTAVVRRDTTHSNEFSWVVIRYVTGNPGAWFLHCHISWHLGAGFGAAMIEGEQLAKQLYCDAPNEAVAVCRRAGVNV